MTQTSPTNLRYTKDHEWARVEGDLVVVGITAHAVEQLGDITLVSLPAPGTKVTRGQSMGDIDSVKAVSELYAPISGEIVELNPALEASPETINEAPYAEGWMVKIRVGDSTEIDALLSAEKYDALVAEGG